jgi:SAM-dependent methyltransferase
MSEERRTAPSTKPLDPGDIPSDLSPASSTAEMAAIPSSQGESESPPPSRAGTRDSSPSVARRRGRTLRIPDDEVTRPRLPGLEGGAHDSVPPSSTSQFPAAASTTPSQMPGGITPMRIISLDSTDLPAALPLPPLPTPPPPPSPSVEPPAASPLLPRAVHEDSWTPYQPTVVDAVAADDRTLVDPGTFARDSETTVVVESAPESLELDDLEPARSTPLPPPPPRALAPTQPEEAPTEPEEGEDVRFEDEVLMPAVPSAMAHVAAAPPSDPSDVARSSDPGAEVSLEDVVAVEQLQPLPPMRPRLRSQPSVPPAGTRQGPQPPAPTKTPLVIVPPHVGSMAPSSEGSGLRRKGRLWWEDLFNDDYLRTCEKLTEEQIAREVDFVEDSLGIERGGAVLDLACGTGRHAIELARRGYEVVGFDLSLAMLARAGEDAQDREAKLNFVQGDMREMTFDEQFDGVFSWNTSFGFFEEEKNALVIDRIHRSLRAGGLFLLDVVNRDFLIRQSPSLAWFEGDGCVCMDEMSVDFITSRMKVKRTMMLDDGRSREIEYSMRIYSLHELGKVLHDHGFKVCEVSGRVATPGVFFGNESPRTIILAEKR